MRIFTADEQSRVTTPAEPRAEVRVKRLHTGVSRSFSGQQSPSVKIKIASLLFASHAAESSPLDQNASEWPGHWSPVADYRGAGSSRPIMISSRQTPVSANIKHMMLAKYPANVASGRPVAGAVAVTLVGREPAANSVSVIEWLARPCVRNHIDRRHVRSAMSGLERRSPTKAQSARCAAVAFFNRFRESSSCHHRHDGRLAWDTTALQKHPPGRAYTFPMCSSAYQCDDQ